MMAFERTPSSSTLDGKTIDALHAALARSIRHELLQELISRCVRDYHSL